MGKFSDTFMFENPDGVNLEYSVKALNANLQSQCLLPESFCTRCVLSLKLQLRGEGCRDEAPVQPSSYR